MLGYRDSGMPDSPANDHPESFHQADLDEATGRLVAVIRRTRPQVVITYGDDQRGYPHPDHLRVHDISVLAFDRAGDPDVVPRRRRAVPAVEAVLLGLVAGAHDRRSTRRCIRAATASRRSTRSGSSAPTATTASPPGSTSATSCGPARRRCGPTPRRSIPTERVLVRARPTTSWSSVYPWEDWILARSLVGPIPDGRRSRATCSPASASRRSVEA